MYRETRTKEKKGWALLNFSWELREKVSEFGLRIKTQSIAFFFHLFKSRCCKRKRKNVELNDSLRLYLNQNSKKSIFQTFFFIELGRWKCEERERKKKTYFIIIFPAFLSFYSLLTFLTPTPSPYSSWWPDPSPSLSFLADLRKTFASQNVKKSWCIFFFQFIFFWLEGKKKDFSWHHW